MTNDSTARNFQDSDASDSALAAADAITQQRQALQNSTDPNTVANASNLQAQYSNLPPDAVVPLAKSGVNANTPGMPQIAVAAAKAKVNKGFGWHSIGDVIKAGASATANVVTGSIHDLVTQPAADAFKASKPFIRGATTALSVGYQGLEGEVRSVHAAIQKHGVLGAFAPKNVFSGDPIYNAEAQTSLGQVGMQHGDGKDVDLGTGFFAGGTVSSSQAAAARNTWAIGGSAATPGRVVANIATEPGTKPYNLLSGLIDVGTSWYGDPANHVLKAAGDARAAGKVLSGGAPTVIDDFEPGLHLTTPELPDAAQGGANAAADVLTDSPKPTSAESKILTNGQSDWEPISSQVTREANGIIDGTRRTVAPANALNWIQSNNGTKVIQRIADTGSYADLRRAFSNGADIDVDTLNQLSKANTPDDVVNILKPTLGIQQREAPQLPNVLQTAATNAFQAVFRRDPEDVRLLGEMPANHIDVNDKNQAVTTIQNFLKNAQVPRELEDKHINAMADTTGPMSMYDATTNAVGDVAKHLGEQVGLPTPASRQITQMFTGYRSELAKYFVDEVGDNYPVLGSMVDGIGKPLPTPHLFSEYINRAIPLPDARAIRTATTTYAKVIKGLQGSDSPAVQKLGSAIKGTTDFGSAFNSVLVGQLFKPAAILRGAYVPRVVGEEQARMAASGLDSLFSHPLSAIAYATGRRGNLDALGSTFKDDADAAGDMQKFAASQTHGSSGWRDRLSLKGRTIYDRDRDPAFPKAWANEIQQLRADPVARRIAGGWDNGDDVPQNFTGNNTADAKRWFWNGGGAQIRKELSQADGRDGLANNRSVSDAFIDSIADRLSIKTGDHPALIKTVATGSAVSKGEDLPLVDKPGHINQKFINQLGKLAANKVGPQVVQGDLDLAQAGNKAGQLTQYYDRAVEYAFDALAAKPTNYLSRSPTFKQSYWDRMTELMPYLKSEHQATVLDNAEKANLANKDITALNRYPGVSGTLDIKDADSIAKSHALDTTRTLLYDMTKKSQFFDMTRNIFPFGSAWVEIFKVWSDIGINNPQIFRRAQQISQGANQSGFFFNDPSTGQESFKYPGTAFLTKQLLGTPIPLSGSIKGANVFGGVSPGFGPTVQWAANALLPDKPQWDDVKKIISPYGANDTDTGVVESYLPAWFQKLRQAGVTPFGRQDPRVWNNTVSDVAKAMVSSGKYNTNSPQAINTLLTAAKSKAKEIYAIRAAAQFFAPSAPTPDFLAKDKDGSMTFAEKLVEDYHSMETKDYKNATANFIDKYGINNMLYMQSSSTSTTPATKADNDWERAHPALAQEYQGVFGLFAPPDDTYDATAEARQIATGERTPLKPDEVIAAANSRVASTIWATATAKLQGRTDAAATQAKASLKQSLMAQYPGWGSTTIGSDAVTISKIQDAMKNPVIADSDAGKATATYLMARDKVQAIAQSRGLSTWTSAKSAEDLRAAMRNVGNALVQEDPAFGNLWDMVFSHEMTADQNEDNSG